MEVIDEEEIPGTLEVTVPETTTPEEVAGDEPVTIPSDGEIVIRVKDEDEPMTVIEVDINVDDVTSVNITYVVKPPGEPSTSVTEQV